MKINGAAHAHYLFFAYYYFTVLFWSYNFKDMYVAFHFLLPVSIYSYTVNCIYYRAFCFTNTSCLQNCLISKL